jgi:hypothetical protein
LLALRRRDVGSAVQRANARKVKRPSDRFEQIRRTPGAHTSPRGGEDVRIEAVKQRGVHVNASRSTIVITASRWMVDRDDGKRTAITRLAIPALNICSA